jgi:hypothetical protein
MARGNGSLRPYHFLVGALAVGGPLTFAGLGCAIVADVDFDAARLASATTTVPEGGALADGSVIGVVPPAPDGSCPADTKKCNDGCVSVTDPAYGCKATECTPCSLAHTTASTCGIGGACIPKGCAAGFDDCDHDPANGCEADLGRKETCGACTTACAAGMLCSPGGCVTDCPVPLVPCGGACVDTKTSATHCGACDVPCAGGANGDPLCSNGTCALTCRPGFGDCANNPAQSCPALPKWYADGDGDGYGTAAFVEACAKPAGYAAASGDCLDSNGAVHPNAPALGTSFAGPNGVSFDYDCNGTETEDGAPEHFPGCVGCYETGYLSATPYRSGPGINSYCGSTQMGACYADPYYGFCNGYPYDVGDPIRCK